LKNISIPKQTVSEIAIAHQLPSWLPKDSQLFIGNSMPIRDCNNYSVFAENIVLACNRGVSGIDGIISTAAGWAVGNQKHSFLLVGDISFMHDIGVLFSLQATSASLTIVLINNSGGGIFSFLPVSKEEDVFETHFATKHSFNLAPIAQAMGIHVQSISSMMELKIGLEQPKKGLSILEVRTDREQNYREHQAIIQEVTSQLKALDI
jgi:2-succinyl-5-enolpyruvyl-6-hydroxy-3-cyclohexene-1-carboxylate synthase